MTSALPPEPAAAPPEPPLDWSVNPWRERARVAVAATASAVAMAALVSSAGLPTLVALVLAVAAVTVLAPGFATSRCRVDDQGVARRLGGLWWDRRPWDRIRMARLVPAGLLVSPERRPGTWAALRGLFLPLPRVERSTPLRAALEHRIRRRGL